MLSNSGRIDWGYWIQLQIENAFIHILDIPVLQGFWIMEYFRLKETGFVDAVNVYNLAMAIKSLTYHHPSACSPENQIIFYHNIDSLMEFSSD